MIRKYWHLGRRPANKHRNIFHLAKTKKLKRKTVLWPWQRFMKYFKHSWMKNLWEEDDFCKIFAFLEEKKLPFFTGMGIPTERRTRTGQRSRTKGQSGEGGRLSIYGIHAPTMLSSNTINSRLHGSQPGFLFGWLWLVEVNSACLFSISKCNMKVLISGDYVNK